METRIYECESKDNAKLKEILEKDPYAKISFARQGYKLKEGKSVGGEAGKYYLYLKADTPFFKDFADSKLADVGIPLKRVEAAAAQKIIESIESEDNAAEKGFGAIFG